MNKRFRVGTTVAALLMLPAFGIAQADFSSGQDDLSDPWDGLKLNTKLRVKLGFRNANIDNVVAFIEKIANVTIVKDPALTGPITVTTSSSVGLAEAFYVLDSNLRLRGFQLARQRKILVIKASPKPPTRTGPTGFGPGGQGGPGMERPGSATVEFYPLTYASASQVARAINDVFQNGTTINFGRNPGGGPGGAPGGGPGGGPGGTPGGFQMSTGSSGNVKASYEEFSNSVIVNAPATQQAQVAALIKKIDQPQGQVLHSKTFKLKYAAASDLATEVQSVLTANASTGRGAQTSGTSTQPQGFGGPFGRFGGGAATSNSNQSMAVADARANALVVTGTEDQLKLAEKVIADLDDKIPTATTTFVFQLQNARSDTVANLLTAAFGQRSGSTASSRNTTVTPSNNTFSNTGLTSTTGRTGGGAGTDTGGDPNSLLLQDPNAASGALLTSVGVTQGFGGGFGGQRNGGGTGSGSGTSSANTAGQSTGHDQNGDVARVHDLTNQVTAISDPNTNSVIVVTSPDNVDLVKNVIDQLDKIPEQVMIQTVIVEATLDKSDQFGLEWNYAQKNAFGGSTATAGQGFGLQNATPALQGFSATLSGGSLSAFFNMMTTDSRFQVLSTPRIFTSNNMEAQINISQSIPYIVSTVQSTTTGSLSYNYAFQDVGIVLTVTPHVTSNGYVTMDVTQTANDLQGYTSFNAPIVNQREAETTVSAKDGETIVLGGMIRNQITSTVNKLPILGDIPILGNLFRNTTKDNQKTELLVFLTPKVVRDPAEAKKMKDESQEQVSPDLQKLMKPQKTKN